jgi:hypothetical protein
MAERNFLTARMKIIYVLLLLLTVSLHSFGQASTYKAAAKYFRVNPLDRKFSVFLNQLMNDTAFITDEMNTRTDSSLFYLRGHYDNFNPFLFKVAAVQLIVSETGIQIDSLKLDTVIVCQITAVTSGNSTANQEDEAKTQYEFFKKKYGKDYLTSSKEDVIESNKKVGEVIDYYHSFPLYAPVLTAYYSKVINRDNYAFSIILRLKIKENVATLPIAPDSF